jgi:hypothetical protein
MDGGLSTPRRSIAVPLVLCGLVLAMPCDARAATAPKITSNPTIDGRPETDSVLTARAEWQGDPAPVATWAWVRCPRPRGACTAIEGATAQTYTVTAADVGSVLRVRLTVTNPLGSDDKRSAPTAPIAAAAPAPVPTATPTPTPAPTPTATATTPVTEPQQTFEVATPPVAAPPVAPRPAASSPRMLSPFPVVRIKGVMTARGARVTLLRLTAPRGVRISVACRGRDCPVRRYVARPGVRRLRRFERDLSAGTRLQVLVTKPGFIGKSTVIVIRRFAAPRRTDRCLPPGVTRAVRCPSA